MVASPSPSPSTLVPSPLSPTAPAKTAAVCTLFEGDYHLGAGALINSLHASGFAGRVICGHRGPPPPWAESARRLDSALEVAFVPVTSTHHLTYYKPEFLRLCWEQHAAAATQLYYCDPDLVVKAPWTVLDRWAHDGIAVCEDVNAYLPARHPYRLAWTDFLAAHNLAAQRPLDRYYNAGFIGLPRADADFLNVWQRVIHCVEKYLGSLGSLKTGTPNSLVHSADQDALNMALMVSTMKINGAGPECMDFAPGGYLLSHAIGPAKPWRGKYFLHALRGRPPGAAHKAFLQHASTPLKIFSPVRLSTLRTSAAAGSLLGRVYRRS
ncbi:hypothetical protein K0B96_06955 [Horticoccus luteus]|uniref:Uncharacterized protein n=1 Tax=Horticoccus luteus TaxID=2862869 RepID=A0A8F9TZ00_9BACT|nr:hypothetical protein [Horticoccus luteus]QYM80343.1 hypothetical protein K0B96_06955 [Horticoccus luteus]